VKQKTDNNLWYLTGTAPMAPHSGAIAAVSLRFPSEVTMPALTFTDVAEVSSKGRVGGSFLVQVGGGVNANAVVYSGILNEDVDGAPRCYGVWPFDAGIDKLRNGTNDENAVFDPLPAGQVAHHWVWRGAVNMTHDEAVAAGVLGRLDERPELAGRNTDGAPLNDPKRFPPKFPVKRADNDQFYVSKTALVKSTAVPQTDPGHWWDATAVNYAALTPPLRDLGVDLGDFGIAIRRDNGTSAAFFFADAGNGRKVGEMSSLLFRTLYPGNNQEELLASFIVFPGSRTRPITNNAAPTVRRLLGDLSNTSNVGTMIDIMAAGTSFAGLSAAPELMYEMNDPAPARPRKVGDLMHRAPGLDKGPNARRSQTIADALRTHGFDPVAAQRAADAEPRSLGLTIPPPSADIMNLKIPK
jgi:hypothetical protein